MATTKTEERIKRLLDDQIDRHVQVTEERMSGVFLYGIVMGIILCYSGLLGYVAGIATGVTITTKYKTIAMQISDRGSFYFHNLVKSVSKPA